MPSDHLHPGSPSAKSRSLARRIPWALGAMLLAYGLGSLFIVIAQCRTALIAADPYSYLLFARELAQGHLEMTGPLAEAITTFTKNDQLIAGPIWNTNVLPDGRPIFTIALGYPLFLALAFNLGGAWLYTSINFLLLLLVALGVTWCIWEGWDRSYAGFLIGAGATLFFVHSQPATFLQFSHPWREPLFYLCVVGGVGGMVRFLTTGRIRTLAIAGMLLGYACAVKEANAIYVMWMGGYLLVSGAWRRHPRRWTALAVFAGAGCLGISPLLMQNIAATGNPLLSTQFMRATSNYAAQEAAPGLNQHNTGNTIARYLLMYRSLPLFHPAFLVVAGLGILTSLKRPVIRLMLGIFVVHLVLYLQWGNADFRHSFFAHIPYSVFVLAGLAWLLEQPGRWIPRCRVCTPWLTLIPLAVLATRSSPWEPVRDPDLRFDYSHATALVGEVENVVEENGILLSNPALRDVLGIYGRLPVVSLQDLAAFHPQGAYADVIDSLIDQGHEIYFLDNRNRTPGNGSQLRRDKIDFRWLNQYYDLVPAKILDSRTHHLNPVTRGRPLTLYRVSTWASGPGQRILRTPNEGGSFLFLNPGAASPLTFRLGDAEFVPSTDDGFYQPLPELPAGKEIAFTWAGAPAGRVPGLADLRIIGFHDIIRQECGPDAVPSDQFVFPDGSATNTTQICRRFDLPMDVRVPIRQTADLFTTIGLSLVAAPTNLTLSATLPDQEPMPIRETNSAVWFPAILPSSADASSRACNPVVSLTANAEAHVKLCLIKSIPAHRRLHRSFAPNEAGIALVGRMAPDRPGPGPHPWSLTVNGQPVSSGRCYDDPRRSLNLFQAAWPNDDTGSDVRLSFTGGGLIQPEWVSVTNQLHITADQPERAFVAEGLYPEEQAGGEACSWTAPRVRVWVPVIPEATGYALVLHAADGHPAHSRNVSVTFAGSSREMPLPQNAGPLAFSFHAPSVTRPGLQELMFEIPSWTPRDVLESDDARQLGFIFYSLSWQPEP